MKRYEINGVKYNVEITGAGPPLLLLHGFTGSLRSWDRIVPDLSQHFKTITVDLLGHGKTDAPNDYHRYSIEHAAQDMIGLLDKLNIERTHLLGYSMGGRLALMVACHYSERIQSLILESSSPGLKTEKERQERLESDEKLAVSIEQNGIEAFIDFWEDIPLFHSQKRVELEKRAKLRTNRLKNNGHGLACSLRGMGTGRQPSLWPELPSLPMPVLLIAGSLDTKYVAIAKELHEQINRAQLAIVNDAGHTVHFEQDKQYITLAKNFLLQ